MSDEFIYVHIVALSLLKNKERVTSVKNVIKLLKNLFIYLLSILMRRK
jgi:hypothetical protein